MSVRFYSNLSEVNENKQVHPEKFGTSKIVLNCAECHQGVPCVKNGLMVPKHIHPENRVGVDAYGPCPKHPKAGVYILRVLDLYA